MIEINLNILFYIAFLKLFKSSYPILNIGFNDSQYLENL